MSRRAVDLNPGRFPGTHARARAGAGDLNLGRVGGGGKPGLGQVLGTQGDGDGDGDDVDAVLDHTFWRAPTRSPLRLVWSADLVRGRLEQR